MLPLWGEKGHWRRACPVYLKELMEFQAKGITGPSSMYMIELNNASISNSWVLDTGCGTHICFNVQRLTRSRNLRTGELDLIMGNKDVASIEMIGVYKLYFDFGLYIVLKNVCHSDNMQGTLCLLMLYILMALTLNLTIDQFLFTRITCFISGLVLVKAYL